MLSGIASAKRSVYLEMYVFESNTPKYDFLSALERKANDGIRVIVVLDAFGSYSLSSETLNRLRNAGAEILFASFWFRRLHRKILVIDETLAFVGGVNISNSYARWKDLQVRVQGKIVHAITRSFARVYRECGGKNHALREVAEKPVLTKARLWLIEHGIGGKRYSFRKHYEKHIDEAEHSVILVTPYFVPHRWLIARLHQAILRGVQVEIIVPEHTDHGRIMDPVNYYHLALFAKLGAACFLSHEMNHAKAMLVDNHIGTIGSNNLDSLSFNWNAEAGIFFDNPGMVRKLGAILHSWKTGAVPFASEKYKRSWYDTILAQLFRAL